MSSPIPRRICLSGLSIAGYPRIASPRRSLVFGQRWYWWIPRGSCCRPCCCIASSSGVVLMPVALWVPSPRVMLSRSWLPVAVFSTSSISDKPHTRCSITFVAFTSASHDCDRIDCGPKPSSSRQCLTWLMSRWTNSTCRSSISCRWDRPIEKSPSRSTSPCRRSGTESVRCSRGRDASTELSWAGRFRLVVWSSSWFHIPTRWRPSHHCIAVTENGSERIETPLHLGVDRRADGGDRIVELTGPTGPDDR
ncbi:MAG: hypothetical protein RIS41_497 [Actinomycetota bacterium]